MNFHRRTYHQVWGRKQRELDDAKHEMELTIEQRVQGIAGRMLQEIDDLDVRLLNFADTGLAGGA